MKISNNSLHWIVGIILMVVFFMGIEYYSEIVQNILQGLGALFIGMIICDFMDYNFPRNEK
jgi:chromate transport protein ChrA